MLNGRSGLFKFDIYKKAYLLEFYKNKTLTDAFCFSVPPENEDLSFGYRITETKTFGGVCIDNYGRDSYKISLSGSTINQEDKFIYRSLQLSPKYMNGEEEIFYLQKLLEKYSDESLKENTELILYDLSKNKISRATTTYVKDCYQVFPTDFKIKRSKDKPFTYDYSIEFIAVDRKQKETLKGLEGIKKIAEALENANNEIEGLYNSVGLYAAKGYDYISQVGNYFSKISDFINTTIDIANGVITTVDVAHRETQKLLNIVFTENIRILTSTFTQTKNGGLLGFNDTWTALHNSAVSLGSWFDKITESTRSTNGINSKSNEIIKLEKGLNQDFEELEPVIQTQIFNLESSIAELKVQMLNGMPTLAIARDKNGDDFFINIYGYTVTKWNQNKTLERLSLEKYGTDEYAYMIAKFNEIISEEDLNPGDVIYLPNLIPNFANENNKVYSLQDKVYGTDIDITGGNIKVFNGDIDVINSKENLQQAIMTRLTTEVGDRIKNMALGIKSNIGDHGLASNYILSSIIQTLEEEPRIQSVDDVSFYGQGDNLLITVGYTDITGNTNTYKSII